MKIFFPTHYILQARSVNALPFASTPFLLAQRETPLHSALEPLQYDEEMTGSFIFEIGDDLELCTAELRDRLKCVYELAGDHEIYQMLVLPCAILLSSGPTQFRALSKQIILTGDMDSRVVYEHMSEVYRVSKELYGTLQELLTTTVVVRFWRRSKILWGV